MKKIFLLIQVVLFSQLALAQSSPNRYEVEILANPNAGKKDTRQVNAVLIFEKESVKILSRRDQNKIFKEFRYDEIEYVEHSFSKGPMFTQDTKAVILMLLTGLPAWGPREEKNWVTIVGQDDFAVLKVENDNYRMIRNEFIIKKLRPQTINEDRQ